MPDFNVSSRPFNSKLPPPHSISDRIHLLWLHTVSWCHVMTFNTETVIYALLFIWPQLLQPQLTDHTIISQWSVILVASRMQAILPYCSPRREASIVSPQPFGHGRGRSPPLCFYGLTLLFQSLPAYFMAWRIPRWLVDFAIWIVAPYGRPRHWVAVFADHISPNSNHILFDQWRELEGRHNTQ